MQVFSRRDLLFGSLAGAASASLAHAGAVEDPVWLDRRSYGPFQCSATFPLADLDPAFRQLAQLEFELQRTLAVPPVTRHVEVLLFQNHREHTQYLRRHYPRLTQRRALYIQHAGRRAVYAYRHRDLPIDLRHECTHALLHANLEMVPLWLDEGLAEYFEMPPTERAFGHPHLTALRWNLRLGFIRQIESLEQARTLDDMGTSQYRFSWAWVHFMLHGPKIAHRTLVAFLADIRRGSPPGRLSERLRQQIPDLDQRMVQHFKHWRR